MENINKTVCLVTGASSGIGKQTAIKISNIVDHVYILSRDVSKLEIVNDQIINNGSDCTIIPMDLTKRNNVKALAKNIYEKENKIDIQKAAASRSTGTDTDAFAFSIGGVCSALISLPLRYMHTTVECVAKDDVENVIYLIYKVLQNIKQNHDFRYFK